MGLTLLSWQEPVWAEALKMETFTRKALTEAAGVRYDQVKDFMRKLEANGIIAPVDIEGRQRSVYRIVNRDAFDHGAPTSKPVVQPFARRETLRGNMWTAMRGLPTFSPQDIAVHAATEETAVTVADAAAYCRLLSRAGYLRSIRKAVPGKREAVYRLIKNTGPRPPRERRVTGVFDDNLAAFVALPGVEA